MHFNYKKLVNEHPDMLSPIESEYRLKFISESELEDLVNKVVTFGPQVWDSKFWGLRKGESISAIAVGYDTFITRLPSNYLKYKEYINQ